ncbi:DUF1565 domain-containing protein [Oscillatoriales cyanobacterium LEGE 11467]|uniref:DUF1565 domain-containing protein n=1 Tax=Zarconia navalis LEGE 11467 TaxID=1828826 RepID=A0A928VWG9_9CYAN|nr:DUF1565 domain-containing protein [Zarconia navalis]MBE9040563.1 DUF1565 domain-containing protein [Zarconia navalis LEGE 11467]
MTFSLLVSLGCGAIAPWVWDSSVLAAESPPASPIAFEADARSATAIYVDPDSGDDLDGNGRPDAPFRSISHALEVAGEDGTVILAPGQYKIETGETFPLRLEDGVTVRGDRSTRGDDIEIYGGGFIFESAAERRNVAIVAADSATLIGVSVTNPHDRGYGVWIESGSPRIVSNRFRKNPQDGISVRGNSTPLIQDNEFQDNGTHGITIAGTAQPDVRDNVFEETGWGIYIAQNAAPLVIGNRITDNEDGVVVQQNGEPVLRGNLIADNDRYGLVAMAQSRSNLGTPDDPGGNMIRDNGEDDLHNSSRQAMVAAFGNQVSPDRTRGDIDFGSPEPIAPELPELELVSASASNSAQTAGTSIPLTPNRLITLATPLDSKNSPSAEFSPAAASSSPTVPPSRLDGVNLELPPPNLSVSRRPNARASSMKPPTSPQSPQFLPNVSSTPTILPVSGSPAENFSSPRSVSELVPALGPLPVPGPNAPVGNSGEVSIVAVQPPSNYVPSNDVSGMPPPQLIPQSAASQRTTSIETPYRVVVEASSIRDRALVRSIVPQAFDTKIGNREVIQVGAFGERDRAIALLEEFLDLGLDARIEEAE